MSSWSERVRGWFRPLDINKLYAEQHQQQQQQQHQQIYQSSASSTPAPNSGEENGAKGQQDATPKDTVESLYESGQYEKAIALFNEQSRVSESAAKAYLRSLAATQQMHHLNVSNLIALLLGPDLGARPNSSGSGSGAAGAGGAANVLGGNGDSTPFVVKIYQSPFSQVARVLMFVAFGFLAYQLLFNNKSGGGGSGILNLMPKGTHKKAENVNVKFDDVKGCDEVLNELMEVVDFLKEPQKYTKVGATLPRGVLLTGPPGTGKTLLARAVAGEAGVPFYYTSGSSFDEMFVGVGPKRVRELFETAKAEHTACIIFIDEIDAMGAARTSSSLLRSRETLNALLTEMDGFDQTSGIIVMAATNLPQSLDPALLRPGRFDRQLSVPAPDIKGRVAILDLYLSHKSVTADVNSTTLARLTPGMTGADLQNVVNTAALKAAARNQPGITQALLEEATDDIRMGVIRRSAAATMHPDEFSNTAVHESGHALVAYYTPGANPLHKMSILPRGPALGVTYTLPERDVYSQTKRQLLAQLAVLMGGHAAEELRYGTDAVTTGAASDFQQATRIATAMVTKYGMSGTVGKVFIDGDDKLPPEVAKEIKSILDERYQYATLLLKTHEHELRALTAELLDHEELSGDEIAAICNGKTLPPLPPSIGRYTGRNIDAARPPVPTPAL
jgi:ATP-dependent metalloprotease